jgi:hypothetical protein
MISGISSLPRRWCRTGSWAYIRWRWSYDASGGVQDLTPYCLRCGNRLVLKHVDSARPANRYECRCDRCGAVACEIDCSVEEFESRVLSKIHETTG